MTTTAGGGQEDLIIIIIHYCKMGLPCQTRYMLGALLYSVHVILLILSCVNLAIICKGKVKLSL
jgi:hypothetical protein